MSDRLPCSSWCHLPLRHEDVDRGEVRTAGEDAPYPDCPQRARDANGNYNSGAGLVRANRRRSARMISDAHAKITSSRATAIMRANIGCFSAPYAIDTART